jgi:hypothetical protein
MSDLRVKGSKSSLYMEALRSRAKIAAELERLVALANRNHEMMVEGGMIIFAPSGTRQKPGPVCLYRALETSGFSRPRVEPDI